MIFLPFFKPRLERFYEIDALRGIAIVLMVIFHFAWDLNFLGLATIKLDSWTLYSIARAASMTFLLLVGVSLSISYSKKKQENAQHIFRTFFHRGLTIFAWGMIITLVTLIVVPQGTIYFGILHLIGLSVILAYPFLRFTWTNLIIGFAIAACGIFTNHIILPFSTYDYFPPIPWFGVVLVGIFLGNKLYPNHTRSFELIDLSDRAPVKCLEFLGRNSLLIYLVHQPVLTGLLYLLTIWK